MSTDNIPQQEDCYAKQYNRHARNLPLTDEEVNRSDKIIAQCLKEHFNDQSIIPMDEIFRFEKIDIEKKLIAENDENWHPQSSIVQTLKSYIPFKKSTVETTEQSRSNEIAKNYLEGQHSAKQVIETLAKQSPQIPNFSLDDAKKIVLADITGNQSDITQNKFPDCNDNLLKAFAYTTLHTHKDEITEKELQDHDFANTARDYIHYAGKETNAHQQWEQEQRAAILNDIKGNKQLLAEIQKIKAPGNITNLDEAGEQYTTRQNIANALIQIIAKNYGLSDTLTPEDIHVVHKSKTDILEDNTAAYLNDPTIGILNNESIFLRYNPFFEHAEGRKGNVKISATDKEEMQKFLATSIEEIQHAVDQIHADKLVLGTLPDNNNTPLHATLIALNKLTYYNEKSDYDEYKNQYIERTAKSIAQDVAKQATDFATSPPTEIDRTVESSATQVKNPKL